MKTCLCSVDKPNPFHLQPLFRQCIIDPSFTLPINFNYDKKQVVSDPKQVMKNLLRLLGYKSIRHVYQLYSKNSRFRRIPEVSDT